MSGMRPPRSFLAKFISRYLQRLFWFPMKFSMQSTISIVDIPFFLVVNTNPLSLLRSMDCLGFLGHRKGWIFPERWGFPVSSQEFRNPWRNPSIFQAPNAELCGKHLELKGLRPRWAVTRWNQVEPFMAGWCPSCDAYWFTNPREYYLYIYVYIYIYV